MHFASSLFHFVMKFGGIGLLVLGTLDSSFLFAPWGNDLLVVAMTAQHPDVTHMLYYALMSAIGSVLGCLLIDITLRPLGAKGLEKHLSKKRIERIEKKVGQKSGIALTLASLAPPPFPFTAFVMAASALQYSRIRMLVIVGITRIVRFVVLGALALRFGEQILRWGKNSVAQSVMIGLVVISVIGSIVSVYGWVKRSRTQPA